MDGEAGGIGQVDREGVGADDQAATVEATKQIIHVAQGRCRDAEIGKIVRRIAFRGGVGGQEVELDPGLAADDGSRRLAVVELGNSEKGGVEFLGAGQNVNGFGISRQGQADALGAREIHVAGFQLAAPAQAEQVAQRGKCMRSDQYQALAKEAGLGQVLHDPEVRRLHAHAAAGDKGPGRSAQCGDGFAGFGLACFEPFDQGLGFRGVPAQGKPPELAVGGGYLPVPVGVAIGVVQVGAAGDALLKDDGVENRRFFLKLCVKRLGDRALGRHRRTGFVVDEKSLLQIQWNRRFTPGTACRPGCRSRPSARSRGSSGRP